MKRLSVVTRVASVSRRVLGTAATMWRAVGRRYRRSWLGLIALLFVVNLALGVVFGFDRPFPWGTMALGLVVNGSLVILYRHGERYLDKILVGIAISFFLFAVNLFGHRSAIDLYGEQLFALLATRWPFGPYGPLGEGSRQRTVVVLLEDKDLKARAWPWPMPYGSHGEILAAIRGLKPQALMIDFLFIDAHRKDDTLPKLRDELRAYRNEHIPVFLAKPLEPDLAVLDELQDHTRLVPVPRFVNDERHNLYPLFLYSHSWQPEGKTERRLFGSPTAAAAVCASDLECREKVLKDDREPKEELALVWGRADPDRWTARWTTDPRQCTLDGLAKREGFFTRLRRDGLIEALSLDCPFTPTVSVSQLLKRPKECPADCLIPGRVVFYGARLEGTADILRPPLRQPLAGVYGHAMAFDNLLTYGEHYKREIVHPCPGHALFGNCRLTRVAQGFIVITAPILFLWLALLLRGKRSGAWPMIVSLSFYASATLFYVWCISVYEFRRLDVIPGNWLEGVVEVVVAVSLTDLLAPKLEVYVKRLLGAGMEPEG